MDYSLLSATTGSFLAAILEGIKPAMNVNVIEMTTNRMACR